MANPVADSPEWHLNGRYHATAFHVDADRRGNANGWDNRRLRIGLGGSFDKKLDFMADVDLDLDGDPRLVTRLNTAFVRWRPAPGWTLTAGKLRRSVLTREDGISTNVLDTVERALLTSVLFVRNYWGATTTYRSDAWSASGSLFSASERGDLGLPESGRGLGFIGNLTHRLDAGTEVRLDVMYNGGDLNGRVVGPYRHVVSLNAVGRVGDWRLSGDVFAAGARAGGPGDARGVVLSAKRPAFGATSIVARTEGAWSGEPEGLGLPSRYARQIGPLTGQRGDRYRAVYVGLERRASASWLGDSTLYFVGGIERAFLDTPTRPVRTSSAMLGFRWFFGY